MSLTTSVADRRVTVDSVDISSYQLARAWLCNNPSQRAIVKPHHAARLQLPPLPPHEAPSDTDWLRRLPYAGRANPDSAYMQRAVEDGAEPAEEFGEEEFGEENEGDEDEGEGEGEGEEEATQEEDAEDVGAVDDEQAQADDAEAAGEDEDDAVGNFADDPGADDFHIDRSQVTSPIHAGLDRSQRASPVHEGLDASEGNGPDARLDPVDSEVASLSQASPSAAASRPQSSLPQTSSHTDLPREAESAAAARAPAGEPAALAEDPERAGRSSGQAWGPNPSEGPLDASSCETEEILQIHVVRTAPPLLLARHPSWARAER